MFSLIPLPIKIGVAAIALVGAAGFGYMKGSEKSTIALANYKANAEEQISDLKDEIIRISDNVTVQYVDRTNTIIEKQTIYRDAVAQVAPQYDLSNGWIHLHDAAARLANPNMELAADSSPSGVMDTTALAVVMNNYGICRQNADQLKALQGWVRDTQAAVAKSNEEKKK